MPTAATIPLDVDTLYELMEKHQRAYRKRVPYYCWRIQFIYTRYKILGLEDQYHRTLNQVRDRLDHEERVYGRL